MKLFYLVTMILFAGCATTVKQGVLEDKKIVQTGNDTYLESENTIENETRNEMWKNSDLEKEIVVKRNHIVQCREILSDPRLGGTGKIVFPKLPMRGAIQQKTEVKGQKVVRTEILTERLEAEKKYGETLSKTLEDFENQEAQCKEEVRVTKAKKGLLQVEEIDNDEVNKAYHNRVLRDLAKDE